MPLSGANFLLTRAASKPVLDFHSPTEARAQRRLAATFGQSRSPWKFPVSGRAHGRTEVLSC